MWKSGYINPWRIIRKTSAVRLINGRNVQKFMEKSTIPSNPFPSIGGVTPLGYGDGAGNGLPG